MAADAEAEQGSLYLPASGRVARRRLVYHLLAIAPVRRFALSSRPDTRCPKGETSSEAHRRFRGEAL